MTSRRAFLTSALAATAAGVLVPEWLLDPPKGRSMVRVPGMPRESIRVRLPDGSGLLYSAQLHEDGSMTFERIHEIHYFGGSKGLFPSLKMTSRAGVQS